MKQGEYFAEEADIFACGAVLFVMVLKSNPFNSSAYNDPYYTRFCKPDNTDFWKIFDPEGILSIDFKDLIEKMMKYNPKDRIALSDIKKHPWYLGPVPKFEEVEFEIMKIGEKIVAFYENRFRTKRTKKFRKPHNSMLDNKFPIQRNTSKLESFRTKMQPQINEINEKISFLRHRRRQQKLEIKRFVKQIEENCKTDTDDSSTKRRNSDPILKSKLGDQRNMVGEPIGDMPPIENRRILSAEKNRIPQMQKFTFNLAPDIQPNWDRGSKIFNKRFESDD